MEDLTWVLIDTETNGFKAPIYTVEIGAQKMRGWEPIGGTFRRLVNQNCAIPREASRIHGYTREILAQKGYPPETVYREFRNYVGGDHPIASFNLSFDWDRVLLPEWERLSIAPIGVRGLCMLKLTQRLLDPCPAGNCQLQTLRQFYNLSGGDSHTALGDVKTTISLLQHILRPLAESQGLKSWDEIERFAEKKFYPSIIPFGKFKGRNFKSAVHDEELRNWLHWLATTNQGKAGMAKWYLRKLGIALPSQERKSRSGSDTIRLEQVKKNIPLSRSSAERRQIASNSPDNQNSGKKGGQSRRTSSPSKAKQDRTTRSSDISPARNCLGGIMMIVFSLVVLRGCVAILPSSKEGEPIRIKGRTYYPTPKEKIQPSMTVERGGKEIDYGLSEDSQLNRAREISVTANAKELEPIPVRTMVKAAKLPTEFRLWHHKDGRQAELQAIEVDRQLGTVVFRMRNGMTGKKTNIQNLIREDQIFLLGEKRSK
ncbi:3'-5' exonuclease [Verrucomicrobiales bacterium BCK34]|nr:3'-5' exonuclease [Verrucomicrobiales bacterium BCK34]